MSHLKLIKNFRRKTLLLLFQFLVVTLAAQNTIYVSPTGNDAQKATLEEPLATIQAALDRTVLLRKEHQLNNTVFIKVIAGEYSIDKPILINETHSGTKTSPLVI